MDHDILYEQIAYYRARAREYDETTGETEDLKGAFAQARELLQQRGPFEQVYHLVFFANWLSHIPPEAFDPFLSSVSRAVRPGGSVAIIDQYAPTPEDRQIMKVGKACRLPRSDRKYQCLAGSSYRSK